MSRYPTHVTQAELERVIRAAKAQGLRIIRIIARADGYAIETENNVVLDSGLDRLRLKPVL